MNNNNPFDYNFFYWGPLLFKIRLQPKDLKKCAKLGSKKSRLVNAVLAGVIQHQHDVDHTKYFNILAPYLVPFQHAYEQWYGRALPKRIVMETAWANFMGPGEFNPPHIHAGCDFSSVLFVKIPKELKDENKKFPGIGVGPGSIAFNYGENQEYSISQSTFFPEEGDLYIFPATLTHFVAPFMSKKERISLSANFKLISNAQ
tara:strand:- start:84 stop:689 length:606 start_codon:yes stop_codon:yes gene_type:complete